MYDILTYNLIELSISFKHSSVKPLQMCNMLGLGDMNADQLASKLEETLPVIRSVSEQFKDPVSVMSQ